MLADTYWYIFHRALSRTENTANLTYVHHLLGRVVYEHLLRDDRVPASSVLSPLLPYSYPKTGVFVYNREIRSMSYIYLEIGEITYVFEWHFGMCEWYHEDALIDRSALQLTSSFNIPYRMVQRVKPRSSDIGTHPLPSWPLFRALSTS